MRLAVFLLPALLVVAAPAGAASEAPARKWTRADARAFLAQRRTQPGVVETRSGLQYRLVEEGTGCRPKPKSVVHVRYQLRLGDDPAVVEDSAKLGPAVALPLTEMIPAWKEGIPLMREGATWEFVVPPTLAYGEQGAPPAVPAHAVLVFRVTLVKAPYCVDAAPGPDAAG
jgi:FKBP-type peptidyl-prolyl cis-trans isomerase